MHDHERMELTLPGEADRRLVILSDIEMGAGGALDDFPNSGWLGELVLAYNRPPHDDTPLDLVLNGDTFDLLKTSYLDTYPRHITRDVALGKMARVVAAHPRFFEALRRFLSHEGAERNVWFVAGNHDPEILIPEVQALLRSLCGHAERVHFPGFAVDFGKVHVEHGSQYDNLFAMEPDRLFVKFGSEEVLNISWGAAAILDSVMTLQARLCFHDRIKPKAALLELMPELKELVLSAFWRYWTREHWKGYFFSGDPTRKLSWRMVKEVLWRLWSMNTETFIEPALRRQLEASDEQRLCVLGHNHQPALWTVGDRKLMQAGCLRDEFMLEDGGRTLRPIPKCYVEVDLAGELPVRSGFVEVLGPAPPPGWMPDSIFDVLPMVRAMLAGGAADEARAAEAHEAKEEREQEREQEREREREREQEQAGAEAGEDDGVAAGGPAEAAEEEQPRGASTISGGAS